MLTSAQVRFLRGHAHDLKAILQVGGKGITDALDYWRWAPELDVVSNDHYLRSTDPESEIDIALSGDLVRSLAGDDEGAENA